MVLWGERAQEKRGGTGYSLVWHMIHATDSGSLVAHAKPHMRRLFLMNTRMVDWCVVVRRETRP
jgi:hypothetical protein